jgi:hypothetical protein
MKTPSSPTLAKTTLAIGLAITAVQTQNLMADWPFGPCRTWYGACKGTGADCGGDQGNGWYKCCLQVEGSYCGCAEVSTPCPR